MGPSHPVGSAGLFGINCLETDSRASLFRNFPTGYLERGVSVFSLDLDRQYISPVKMDDLFLGKDELGNQVLRHPIFPSAVDAVIRILSILWLELNQKKMIMKRMIRTCFGCVIKKRE
jgi:hypothetical protein